MKTHKERKPRERTNKTQVKGKTEAPTSKQNHREERTEKGETHATKNSTQRARAMSALNKSMRMHTATESRPPSQYNSRREVFSARASATGKKASLRELSAAAVAGCRR